MTGLVTSNGDIKVKTDTIAWADVTAIQAQTDTIDWSDIVAIQTDTDTIAWSDVAAIRAKTDTIDWSDITSLPASVASAVWSAGTRSLTTFGSLASDVWSAGTRTLTGAGLTSGSLATQSDVNNASTTINANVAAIKTKTDTIDWSDVTDLVTVSGDIQDKTDTIDWGNVSDIKTKTDSISWSDVTGIKTKTDTIVWGDITTVKANVATLISEVGTGNISAIKTDTDTIAWADITGLVTSSGQIKAKTDTIAWADVTAIKTNTDTIDWNDVTGLVTNVDSVKSKTDTITWADVDDIKTKTDAIDWSDVTSLPSNVATAVWSAGTRSLTTFGSLASDVWSAGTRTLTGAGLSSGSLAILSDLSTQIGFATSSINSEILANRSLINGLNDISATDVWAAATRTLTSAGVGGGATATEVADEVWGRASSNLTSIGSIGKLLADNIDAQISTAGGGSLSASDIWSYANRTLSDYATSTISSSVAQAVWSNGLRDLTDYGNDITAQAVWDSLTSNLTTVDSVGKLLVDNIDEPLSSRASLSGQQASWNIIMSNYSAVQTGKTYRAKIQVLNDQSAAENPYAAPRVTLYDADRNVVVSSVAMTNLATGQYEYAYSIPSGASQGVWETVIQTEVENGKTITNNDYWLVSGSPAQVIINSVTPGSPDTTANLTITNEGLAGYEYQYEWCVVSGTSDTCGGGDDVYHGTGAKFINPGEDWNTNLTATVPDAGNYYFKVIVYFGAEKSGSSRSFSIAGSETPPENSGGGGGGGGGAKKPKAALSCVGADFNNDSSVNSIDFSILLAFWKTEPPFKNKCVDINKDNVVSSVDFSILLSQWGTRGKALTQ